MLLSADQACSHQMRRKSVQSLYGEREMKHRGQAEFGRRQERPQEQARQITYANRLGYHRETDRQRVISVDLSEKFVFSSPPAASIRPTQTRWPQQRQQQQQHGSTAARTRAVHSQAGSATTETRILKECVRLSVKGFVRMKPFLITASRRLNWAEQMRRQAESGPCPPLLSFKTSRPIAGRSRVHPRRGRSSRPRCARAT